MTLAEILRHKTAGGADGFLAQIKTFFVGDIGDTSVSKPERWVFMAFRFIFHIAAAICTFYAPMKILPEPFQEVFPEWGNTIAKAISCVFVFGVEFFTYSIARRATISCLKVWHEDFELSILGSTVFWLLLSFGIGWFSYECAIAGSHNIIFQKTNHESTITASKDAKVDVLKSDYKELAKTTTDAHNRSISEASAALATYQKRKWTDPETVKELTRSVESARKAKKDALEEIKLTHAQDLADQEGKTKPLLEKNAEKQSMYQKYIPTVSLMQELGKFLFIFLLVQLGYKPTKKQQRRQERFEPQDEIVEKKSPIHISQAAPTPIVLEEVVEMSKSGNAIEYSRAVSSMRKIKHDIKAYVRKGNEPTESMIARWNDGQERLRKAAEALGEDFKPETMPKLQTNP